MTQAELLDRAKKAYAAVSDLVRAHPIWAAFIVGVVAGFIVAAWIIK